MILIIMDTKDLELAIRKLIEDLYNVEYRGIIKVKELFTDVPYSKPQHRGYKMSLGPNKMEKPIELACDGDECVILDFIAKELTKNRYDYIEYFTAEKIYFSRGCCKK